MNSTTGKATLSQIHEDLGRILSELSVVATNHSALHVKVDAITIAFKHLANDRMEDRFNIERYGRRIQSLEHQLALVSSQRQDVPNWNPDPREITGTHDFAVVKAQFDAMRTTLERDQDRKNDSMIWWKRQRWLWVGAIAVVLATTLITGCFTYVITRVATTPSVPAGK